MDNFFSFVSKAVIVIPIIIIVLSLLMKLNQNPQKYSNNIIRPSTILSPSQSVTKKINLDLNGSFICNYENEKQKYHLSVKNKKINLKITAGSQIKEYDLSSYASMIQTMFNLDIDRLESMAKPYLPKGADLETLLKSCK